MFCSNCGEKASGQYCSHCGTRLGAVEAILVDWEDEIRYDALLQVPEVRGLIARHAAQARRGLSGEKFLELCDLAFSPIPGMSLAKVASIVAPVFARLGIRTGKTRTEFFPQPPGKLLAAALCSLARHGRSLKAVHQGKDGCVLEAVLPSDIWSFAGMILVSLECYEDGVEVMGATRIPGQLFDWGKSKRALRQLFADLDSLLE